MAIVTGSTAGPTGVVKVEEGGGVMHTCIHKQQASEASVCKHAVPLVCPYLSTL